MTDPATPALPAPEITSELRSQARMRPGDWLYVIDPELDPEDRVPPQGIRGAWKVSGAGEIEGDFVANAQYRPSPTALGWPVAQTPLERATQMTRAGLWPIAAVVEVLERETVHVPDEHDGRPIAYTLAKRSMRSTHPVPGAELASALADGPLTIDPGHASELTIPATA